VRFRVVKDYENKRSPQRVHPECFSKDKVVQAQTVLLAAFKIVEILYNAPSIRFPNVLLVDARQRLHGRTCHDPARNTRFFSAGGLHPCGCACLSKDAGSLI
jgi:hypothetical protein